MGDHSLSSPEGHDASLSLAAKGFVWATSALGLGVVVVALASWPHQDWVRFGFYLAVAALSSGLKVRFPGIDATVSVNFFFNLLIAVELGLSQAVVIAGLSAVMQIYWRPERRPELIQVPFNISLLALSSAAAALTFDAAWGRGLHLELMTRIVLAGTAQFCTNSFFLSAIVILAQGRKLMPTLRGFIWPFPYYFVGAVGVGLFHELSSYVGWQSALLLLPAAYLVFRSFQIYLDRLNEQKRHAKQMSDLQRRTIEALALAIECKDETTHQHLSRVQIYALEIGQELKLTENEMEALRAASLLHDIGKLAVPESIINKPGKLTPDEFNKMKIHPGVGAEILSSVQFPYPVVPFVRSHHEKWDGTGYPDGLSGEQIPIGARIIAVVDCLDALASDRQYRKALPLPQAMDVVRKESERAFDPKIVEILERRYVEFESKARVQSALLPKLSLDIHVKRGGAPGAGFATDAMMMQTGSLAALASAVDGRRLAVKSAVQLISEFSPQLTLEECAALADVRLRRLVPNDAMVIYRLRRGELFPVYASGEDSKVFAGLRIPLGQGLSGWVAENRKPILNGNPAVEPGYPGGMLRSSMAVPIEAGQLVIGVLAVHSLIPDAFSAEDCLALLSIASAVAKAGVPEAVAVPVPSGDLDLKVLSS